MFEYILTICLDNLIYQIDQILRFRMEFSVLVMNYSTMGYVSFAAASCHYCTHSANVKNSSLSFLLVAAGQDHPGSSLCQIQSRRLANASVASCAGQWFTHTYPYWTYPYPHTLPHSPVLFYHPTLCPICQPNHYGVKSIQQICPQPLWLSPTRHSHFWHCLHF